MRFSNHSDKYLILIMALLMAGAFAFVACGGDEGEDAGKKVDDKSPEKEVKEGKDVAVKEAAKKTEIRVDGAENAGGDSVPSEYQYNPINKVDPFVSFIEAGFDQPSNIGSEAGGILTQFEVRYFRLVGIVSNEEQPRAIFEDARGHAYVVGIGTKIGRNNGVIEQINDSSVLIIEKRIKFTVEGGEPVSVPLTINLHPQREE